MPAEATLERYVIRTDMHLGPLRRRLHTDSVIEWEPITELMRINGMRIEAGNGIKPAEAMRQLHVLSERNPDNPPIVALEESPDEEPTQQLETSTLCVLPVLGCLVAAEQYLDEQNITAAFHGVTEQQREFLEAFEDLMYDVSGIDELKSVASPESSVVNAWLEDNDFDIQLASVDAFAVASMLNVVLKWLYKGKITSVTGAGGSSYPGVSLTGGVTVHHAPAVHPHPVVRVATQSGDTACMSMVDAVPDGFAGLFLKAADLAKVKATSHSYRGVCCPMIDLDIQPDISWIAGMEIGGGHCIGTALQQTKFRMSEDGAKTENAAAMSVRGANTDMPHVIDRPFLLWIQRDGIQFPLFAALLCEDVWKKPTSP